MEKPLARNEAGMGRRLKIKAPAGRCLGKTKITLIPRLAKEDDKHYNSFVPNVPEDLEKTILDYKQVVSFRVKKALGSFTPDWEDVVNEIMTQVLEKVRRQEFRGESSIGTFIYIVTSRRIVDHIRNKTKVLRHAPDPGYIPEPEEPLEQKERADLLARLIKQLKPQYRDVLQLYYYKEMSRDEVAGQLGISPSKVSERLHYAQKLLRKKLRP